MCTTINTIIRGSGVRLQMVHPMLVTSRYLCLEVQFCMSCQRSTFQLSNPKIGTLRCAFLVGKALMGPINPFPTSCCAQGAAANTGSLSGDDASSCMHGKPCKGCSKRIYRPDDAPILGNMISLHHTIRNIHVSTPHCGDMPKKETPFK